MNLGQTFVIGIDPGPKFSSLAMWVRWKFGTVEPGYAESFPDVEFSPNIDGGVKSVRDLINGYVFAYGADEVLVAVEGLANYSTHVGEDTFRTAYAIGRIIEICDSLSCECMIVLRKQVITGLCGSARLSDSELRQAIYDLHGGEESVKGRKCQACKGKGLTRAARSAPLGRCINCAGTGWIIRPQRLAEIKGSHGFSALGVAITAARMKDAQ